jgi:hypothetical protein
MMRGIFQLYLLVNLVATKELKCHMKQLFKVGLLHTNHDFATHIPNLFFEVVKVLIDCVLSSSWIQICKGKFLGHQLQAHKSLTNQT